MRLDRFPGQASPTRTRQPRPAAGVFGSLPGCGYLAASQDNAMCLTTAMLRLRQVVRALPRNEAFQTPSRRNARDADKFRKAFARQRAMR